MSDQTNLFPAAGFSDKGGYTYNIEGEMVQGGATNDSVLAARPTPDSQSVSTVTVKVTESDSSLIPPPQRPMPTATPMATQSTGSMPIPADGHDSLPAAAPAYGPASSSSSSSSSSSVVNTPPTPNATDTNAVSTSSPAAALPSSGVASSAPTTSSTPITNAAGLNNTIGSQATGSSIPSTVPVASTTTTSL